MHCPKGTQWDPIALAKTHAVELDVMRVDRLKISLKEDVNLLAHEDTGIIILPRHKPGTKGD